MGTAFDAWKKKYASNISGLANSNDTAGNYGKGPVDMGVGDANINLGKLTTRVVDLLILV